MRMYALTDMTVLLDGCRDTSPGARGDSASSEAVVEGGQLGAKLLGDAVAEAVVEVLDVGDLLAPALHVDPEQLGHPGVVEAEAVGVEGVGGGQQADRGRHGVSVARHPLEDPLQHPAVVTEAGPQELAVGVLAEPVDEEDLREPGAPALAHL